MRKGNLLGVLTLGVAIACFATGATAQASETVNVGEFIVELAKTRNLNSADPIVARDSLAAVGILLPANLDPRHELTEGDVTRIAGAVGLRLSTSRPAATFDRTQLQRFFATFGGEIAGGGLRQAEGDNPGQGSGPGNGNGEPPFDPFSKGQGKKKGKAKRPTTEVDPT